MPRLVFRDVTDSNWRDFERLFAARGGPKNCWCMAWRANARGGRPSDSASRKAAIKGQVQAGTPVGILGYLDGEAVAWCSVAPRLTFRVLGGPDDFADTPDAVWSLVCFFIRRDLRGQGTSTQLLKAAITHARKAGGRILEAYPVDPDSPSYRFMGFIGLFEKAGFQPVGRAGTRRHVMRLALD